jgi:hypothetical protein
VDLGAEWPVLVPPGGVLVALIVLIIHLMRQQSGDRGDYQRQLIALRRQHSEEIEKLIIRHDRQVQDIRLQLGVSRAEVVECHETVEEERRARWSAEDSAAKYRRMIEQDGREEGRR